MKTTTERATPTKSTARNRSATQQNNGMALPHPTQNQWATSQPQKIPGATLITPPTETKEGKVELIDGLNQKVLLGLLGLYYLSKVYILPGHISMLLRLIKADYLTNIFVLPKKLLLKNELMNKEHREEPTSDFLRKLPNGYKVNTEKIPAVKGVSIPVPSGKINTEFKLDGELEVTSDNKQKALEITQMNEKAVEVKANREFKNFVSDLGIVASGSELTKVKAGLKSKVSKDLMFSSEFELGKEGLSLALGYTANSSDVKISLKGPNALALTTEHKIDTIKEGFKLKGKVALTITFKFEYKQERYRWPNLENLQIQNELNLILALTFISILLLLLAKVTIAGIVILTAIFLGNKLTKLSPLDNNIEDKDTSS